MTFTRIALTAVGLILSAHSFAGITSIDVFHTNKLLSKQKTPQIKGVEVNYYYLPAMQELDTSLSNQLPSNEKDASIFVSKFFSSEEGERWIKATKDHSEGLAKLFTYEIDKTPAIVFDGSSVVYGTSDIQEAINAYIN